MKLLRETYKTFEGARKRAAFENAVAPGEYRRGDKMQLYRYTVEHEVDRDGRVLCWRVARHVAK